MSIRVGVDATGWDNRRGYGRFLRGVVTALAADPGPVVLELFADTDIASRAGPSAGVPAGVLVTRLPAGRAALAGAASGSRRRVRDLVRAGSAVRSSPVDVMLFPTLLTWFPARGVPSVVGVHDVIPWTHGELAFASRSDRLAWRVKERLAIRRATAVFTVSRAARADLAAVLGLDPSRVAVVPEAPDSIFRTPPTPTDDLLAPLGVGGSPFVLCAAGGVSPHKDVETAIRAQALLVERRPSTPALVVVGALEGDGYTSAAQGVARLVGELGLREHVHLTGYVPDETLAALYAEALAVVNPSLAEGFGLPAVEAAAAGAAVVLADIPAHRETLGEAAAFFPPGDAGALADAVGRLVGDPDERAAVGARCRAAVEHLSWDAAARALRDVLLEAAAHG